VDINALGIDFGFTPKKINARVQENNTMDEKFTWNPKWLKWLIVGWKI